MYRKRSCSGTRFRWCAALLAGLVVAGLAGCTGADKPSTSESDGPPEDGELTVVESGLTDKGESNQTEEGEIRHVAFGVIVENTSRTRTVEVATLTVEFIDADGEPMTYLRDYKKPNVTKVHLVRPGERAAFGHLGVSMIGGEAVEVGEVAVSDVSWLPAKREAPEVTIDDVDIDVSDTSVNIDFTIHAEPDGSADVGELEAVAILRNDDGEIVAGDEAVSSIGPGDSSGEVGFSRVRLPPDTDLDATKVYLR